MKWLWRWLLSRAESALTEARQRREAADLEESNYGGLLAEQMAEEVRIEQRIAVLRERLASRSLPDTCGTESPVRQPSL